MKIIISPAKQMKIDTDSMIPGELPVFLPETKKLLEVLKCYSFLGLKRLFQANEKITRENLARFVDMDLENALTPALLSYVGIQYQYMAPQVFTKDQWNYVIEHLRILSGFYGILCPDDKVTPYRLEMQAKLQVEENKDLYAFWGDKLYKELVKDDKQILNLASKEYSRCIEAYLESDVTYISCVFGELIEGKVKVKGTLAKMARGEMVRWMAENQITQIEEVKRFSGLGYSYEGELSTKKEYVFLLDSGKRRSEMI